MNRKLAKRLGCFVAALCLGVGVAGMLIWSPSPTPGAEPVASASSSLFGRAASNAVGENADSANNVGWTSDGETIGAWIAIDWGVSTAIDQIRIGRNPLDEPGIIAGVLSFSDESRLYIALSSTDRLTTISFIPRTVSSARFTALKVSPGTVNVSVTKFGTSKSTPGNSVRYGDTTDGDIAKVAQSVEMQEGSSSRTGLASTAELRFEQPRGAALTYRWAQARQVSAIELVGSPYSVAALKRARVVFDDGSQLPVGAVDTGIRTTRTAFMPRVLRQMRVILEDAAPSGPLTLAHIRVIESGSAPASPGARASLAVVPLQSPTQIKQCPLRSGLGSGLSLNCPDSGTVFADNLVTTVTAHGLSDVTAVLRSADGFGTMSPNTSVRINDEQFQFRFDARGAPSGPMLVSFVGRDLFGAVSSLDVAFYHEGQYNRLPALSAERRGARDLVYVDDFEGPLSVSRDGRGSDYASAKPTASGPEEFGEAIFGSREDGLPEPDVLGPGVLHLGLQPLPAGRSDPQAFGRTSVGGLVASAAVGGSGFSAQYGYFEARMFSSAAPGTWPAFWMLPSDNLAVQEAQPAGVGEKFGSEIDAVEMYGHDPTETCHSTHNYKDGARGGDVDCLKSFVGDGDAARWHVYGVDVGPTENRFYIDGVEVASLPQVPGADSPMFFLVNMALGGGWPVDLGNTSGRAELYVDYVRVYV